MSRHGLQAPVPPNPRLLLAAYLLRARRFRALAARTAAAKPSVRETLYTS